MPEARLDAPKSARVDDLSTSSDARRARFSNFAAPVRQILAGITAHVIGAPIARVFTQPGSEAEVAVDIEVPRMTRHRSGQDRAAPVLVARIGSVEV